MAFSRNMQLYLLFLSAFVLQFLVIDAFSVASSSLTRARRTQSGVNKKSETRFISAGPHSLVHKATDDGDARPEEEGAKVKEDEGEDDPRLYNINLSRATGIDWGTDLSFRWVYVMNIEPGGAADLTDQIKKGHQLIAVNGQSVLGASFDLAMGTLAAADGREVALTFFRGTREELQEATVGSTGPSTITLTVREKGEGPEKIITAPAGANLRDVLIANNINVYQSITRWTNCKGKQLCGTCIVNVAEGFDNTSRRGIDEASTLRDNPPTYRLSCVTNMHGDLTVETYPEIGAYQWTR